MVRRFPGDAFFGSNAHILRNKSRFDFRSLWARFSAVSAVSPSSSRLGAPRLQGSGSDGIFRIKSSDIRWASPAVTHCFFKLQVLLRLYDSFTNMRLLSALLTFIPIALVAASAPGIAGFEEARGLEKRETSYGNPDLVVDQGNRWKLNFGSTGGHPNACPGHYICYIGKRGGQHGDVSFGNPDDMVDEGNRWRFNYGSRNGHDNACPGHYICYVSK
ncbi:hypothetical protein HGRIS_005138 [Hohenbuehelia grisea]|uniref:Uncharacterized protein n=1 Tax=Hohenbuehelia grisea TaxID=104357 RepID=A0ABR3JEB4_9AGAR